MQNTKAGIATLCFWILASPAVLKATPSYWQQHVQYTILAHLDTTKHEVLGEAHLLYTNNSPDTLSRFYLLLYANAFRDPSTTAMQEARQWLLSRSIDVDRQGWTDIETFEILSVNGKSDLPLSAYKVEDTVLEAALPEPLPPSANLEIRLRFRTRLSRDTALPAYRKGFYHVAHWYPRVAVYDSEGWHAEPRHLFGDPFGEFATFQVTLEVPGNLIVVASGIPQRGNPGWQWVQVDTSLDKKAMNARLDSLQRARYQEALAAGYRQVHFVANNTHDFAWVAFTGRVHLPLDIGDLEVHLFYPPDQRDAWQQKAPGRIRNILKWVETKFGPYPYPQLAVVQADARPGAMHPMFMVIQEPAEFPLSHGIGHEYFYHALANDEVREAWLDEGLTVFQTKWYLEEKYGRFGYDHAEILKNAPSFLRWYKLPTLKQLLVNFLQMYQSTGHDEPIARPVHGFTDPMSFGMNVYLKGALFFDMLKYVVGDSVFEAIMRTYVERWRFKHPNEQRFRAVCEEISGQDLGWFFDQWLHNTAIIDYALEEVQKSRRADGTYETTIEIANNGTGIMPVDILLVSNNGDSLLYRWHGRGRSGHVTVITPFKPDRVLLDPQDAILDNNLLDNGYGRFEWHFDLPLQEAFYQPRAAYLILWRPSLGYNDIDGLRVGGQIRGSYKGLYRRFRVATYAGLKSGALDGLLSWENALDGRTNNRRYSLLLQKKEGRLEIRAQLDFVYSRYLTRPPFHQFTLGWHHLETRDVRYGNWKLETSMGSRIVPLWDHDSLNRLYLTYHVDPQGNQWQADLYADLAVSLPIAGSRHAYRRASLEFSAERRFGALAAFVRGYAGRAFGDLPPLQDRFFLDGASPLERWMSGVLPSRGSNYGLALYAIGGGNVRGYVSHGLSGRGVLAATAEWRATLPVIPLQLAAFYDLGRLQLPNGKDIVRRDAGIALAIDGRANGLLPIFNSRFILRLDFPLYLSHPEAGERSWRFRWNLGMRFSR